MYKWSTKLNNIFSWEFYSENNNDIAFAIYRKEDKMIPVVSRVRVDCHLSAEKGEICCEVPGLCKCKCVHYIYIETAWSHLLDIFHF